VTYASTLVSSSVKWIQTWVPMESELATWLMNSKTSSPRPEEIGAF
jgi:hypothetical protein